jgi:hypothetical protein
MGVRRLILVLPSILALGACGPKAPPAPPRPPVDQLPARVVWDFEHAVLESKDAYVALFDFTAVGELEILLHRYDALGRKPDEDPDERDEYMAEDGTPYPPTRERRNVGNFYGFLIKPAINHGHCQAVTPTWEYNRLLGEPFPELPPGSESHEALREKVNTYLDGGAGGVIGIRCPGGTRGLALVYTRRDNERGYDLITIYDDGPDPQL